MTGLLVSVRDPQEARLAVEAGVDIIDAKDPARGPLGAVDSEMLAKVIQAVAGRVPVSAAMGELLECLRPTSAVSFAKHGLAGCARKADWKSLWSQSIARLPTGVAPVAVVYADWEVAQSPAPDAVLTTGLELGCRVLLVDTFDKRGGSLLEIWGMEALERFVERVHMAGIALVLAGSLSAKTIQKVLHLHPAYVAVRGAAAYRGVREEKLDQRRVQELVHLVRSATRA